VTAIKRIVARAAIARIVPWLMLRPNLPLPEIEPSFSFNFSPTLSHLVNVYYLTILHRGALFMAFQKAVVTVEVFVFV
jgi:hypothetical protein